MSRLLCVLLIATGFAIASPARAFTPESGWWWNPDEPGYGFAIEVQDKFIFMAAYTYAASGSPRPAKWYAAQGEMQRYDTFQTATFYTAQNGTCLGCPFTQNQIAAENPGTIRIEFDTETTATLTWGGRTIPIERHNFFLGADPQIAPKTELWLGEWQAVTDFSEFGGNSAAFPFLGEALVFDRILTEDGTDFFDGCRPTDSLVGLCAATPVHPASGFYSAPDDTNIILVYDNQGQSGSDPNDDEWLVYEVIVGLTQFDGYGKVCFDDELGDVFDLCLDNDNVPAFAARGWRSKSRSYVLGDDNAPHGGLPPGKAGLVREPKNLVEAPATPRPHALRRYSSEKSVSASESTRANAEATQGTFNQAVMRVRQKRAGL